MTFPEEIRVEEDLPDHHFRTEIPNCISYAGLDPYELSVYFHLKRIAGDTGSCWQSHKTLASHVGISERKLRDVLKNLETGKNKLNLKLIRKTARKREGGFPATSTIHIINIWKFNGDFFKSKKNTTTAPGALRHHMPYGPTAPHADKEEPIPIRRTPPPIPIQPKKTSEPKSDSNGGGGFSYKKNGKGERAYISEDLIFDSLSEFRMEIIKRAMVESAESPDPISNPIRYLKKICERLQRKDHGSKTASHPENEERKAIQRIRKILKKMGQSVYEDTLARRKIIVKTESLSMDDVHFSLSHPHLLKLLEKICKEERINIEDI